MLKWRHRSRPSAATDCHVAGIGSSAGGITALQRLFQTLPADPNIALVVVQHLAPGHSSGLADLLGKWSSLPVQEAKDGDRPERNHVYVASPDDVLTLEGGVFRTRPVVGGERRPGIDTIDALFESLAQDRSSRAIAVVLSGTGTDGSAGVICVKQLGGVVIVQDPVTAMHESMPNSAIARGAVDYILPVGEIARQLVVCASEGYVRPQGVVSSTRELTKTLDDIVGMIRKQAGFDLSGYKPTPVLWRIQQRMDIRRVMSFPDYASLLQDDPAELEALIRRIPIHVTEFFRDAEAWEALSRQVIAPLLSERKTDEQIRVWTPGCATGEEAYSVAMLLSEHVDAAGKPIDFQVFATDASPEILAHASRGSFSEKGVKGISPERRSKFFYSADGTYRVNRSLREKMVFAPQDLLLDPPFAGVDLVTCRNLLIYLDRETVTRVLFLLHSSLRVGGYLFLGKAEALSLQQQGFEAVANGWNIYRKIGPAPQIKMKFPTRLQSNRHIAVAVRAHQAAVEHLDVPSVLIDEGFRILRVYGDTDKILRLPAGEPTDNLLGVVHRDLVEDLKIAAKKALTDHDSVTVNGLRDGATGRFSLTIRLTPIQIADGGADARLLVSFIRAQDAAASNNDWLPRSSSDVLSPQEFSEAIRISHAELEASREELQALNEELKASNDQLNITNEDLSRANDQLKSTIAELKMQSRVLSSGAVVTLFLDEDLRLRWFTPPLRELFPVIPADVGRRITDFVPRFDDPTFLDDVSAVMKVSEPREAEVRNSDGVWFLRRTRPYLSASDKTAGVAVTFTDITERKRSEQALLKSEERLRAALSISTVGVIFWGPDFTITDVNDAFLRMSGFAREEAIGKPWQAFTPPEFHALSQKAIAEVSVPGKATTFEKQYLRKDGSRWWGLFAPRRIGEETVEFVLDVTLQHDAKDALRESEERQTFLLKLSDELRPLGDTESIKTAATKLIGEQLQVNRAFYADADYADADNGCWLVTKGFERGVTPLPDAPFPMLKYGHWIIRDFHAGKTLVVEDMHADSRFSEAEREAHEVLDIGSEMAVPLVKNGVLVAMLVVHALRSRTWSKSDVALLEETAERTWAAVERAHVEAALRKSEERRALAFEAAEMGAWDYDLVADVCHFDARAQKLYSLPSDALDHRPEGVAAVVHPDDVGPMFDAIQRASDVNGNGRYDIDYRISQGNGQYCWLRAWGKAEFKGEGAARRAVRIVGASRDVTLEKEAERYRELLLNELVASKSRLAAELAAAQRQNVGTERISEQQG